MSAQSAMWVIVMSNSAAKPDSSGIAKPPMVLTSSRSAARVAESKPNAGSKPDSHSGRPQLPMTAETRRAMVAQAAYYIAEQRGFICGREVEDWLLAEKQIDSALSS